MRAARGRVSLPARPAGHTLPPSTHRVPLHLPCAPQLSHLTAESELRKALLQPKEGVADDGTPRVCDFELSKDLNVALSSTMVGGTRGFMAPEVLSGHARPSAASDMYAFGVLVLNTVCPPSDAADYPLIERVR